MLHYANPTFRTLLTGAQTAVLSFTCPLPGTLTEVAIYSGVAAATSEAVFDVHKNGVTIFADQATRPRLLVGATVGSRSGLKVACLRGDLITIDLDTVHASGVGNPVSVIVTFDDGGATLSVNEFIADAYEGAFARTTTTAELNAALSSLNTGCAQGLVSTRTSAQTFIASLFTSAEYTARARTDGQYVDDLYLAYLGRAADTESRALWVTQVASLGRAAVRASFAESLEFINARVGQYCPNALQYADAVSFRGISLATTPPANGQVYAYNTAANQFLPTTPAAGGGGGDATTIRSRAVAVLAAVGLSDDFTDAARGAQWVLYDPLSATTTSEATGQLVIVSNTVNDENGYIDAVRRDYRNQTVTIKLVSLSHLLQGTTLRFGLLDDADGARSLGGSGLALFSYGVPSGNDGFIYAVERTTGGTYDNLAHKFAYGGAAIWLRLRHVTSTNLIHFETSADGTTYTTHYSKAPIADLDLTRARVFVTGVTTGTTATRTVTWDDYVTTLSVDPLDDGELLAWDAALGSFTPRHLSPVQIASAYASNADLHTSTAVWEDIASLGVPFIAERTGRVRCDFTAQVAGVAATGNEYIGLRFVLDGATFSEVWVRRRDVAVANAERHLISVHTAFRVTAGAHTFKVQWRDESSGLDVNFYERRLTCTSAPDSIGTYSELVLARSPVFYYKLNETTGRPIDYSGNSNHVSSVTGAPTYRSAGLLAGSTDAAVTLTGSQVFRRAVTVGGPLTPAAGSLVCLFKPTTALARHDLMTYNATDYWGTGRGIHLYIATTGKLSALVGTSGSFTAATGTTVLAAGLAYHCAVTWGASQVKVYLNGLLEATINIGAPDFGNGTEWQIGGNAQTGGPGQIYASGVIDEAALFGTALTEAQIIALAAKALNG